MSDNLISWRKFAEKGEKSWTWRKKRLCKLFIYFQFSIFDFLKWCWTCLCLLNGHYSLPLHHCSRYLAFHNVPPNICYLHIHHSPPPPPPPLPHLDGGKGAQVRGKDNTINLFSPLLSLHAHHHTYWWGQRRVRWWWRRRWRWEGEMFGGLVFFSCKQERQKWNWRKCLWILAVLTWRYWKVYVRVKTWKDLPFFLNPIFHLIPIMVKSKNSQSIYSFSAS